MGGNVWYAAIKFIGSLNKTWLLFCKNSIFDIAHYIIICILWCVQWVRIYWVEAKIRIFDLFKIPFQIYLYQNIHSCSIVIILIGLCVSWSLRTWLWVRGKILYTRDWVPVSLCIQTDFNLNVLLCQSNLYCN